MTATIGTAALVSLQSSAPVDPIGAALVERMKAGEVRESREPDGRWRDEFEESGAKRMMFLSEEQRRLAISARDG